MSRTAAAPGSRWKGWRGVEYIRKDDPRWFKIALPQRLRRKCPTCKFNNKPVSMRVWVESIPSWRCPCCGFQESIDQAKFEAFVAVNR